MEVLDSKNLYQKSKNVKNYEISIQKVGIQVILGVCYLDSPCTYLDTALPFAESSWGDVMTLNETRFGVSVDIWQKPFSTWSLNVGTYAEFLPTLCIAENAGTLLVRHFGTWDAVDWGVSATIGILVKKSDRMRVWNKPEINLSWGTLFVKLLTNWFVRNKWD